MMSALQEAERLLLAPAPPPGTPSADAVAACRKRCVTAIATASTELHAALERARKCVDDFKQAKDAGVGVEEVVAYAQKISGTTSAPAYWREGLQIVGFLPPAPEQERMRGGALTKFNANLPAAAAKHNAPMELADYFASTAAAAAAAAAPAKPDSPPGRRGSTSVAGKREREGGEARPGALYRAPSFSEKPEKKPKIIVDLDDLDSSSEEEGSSGSGTEGDSSD